MFILHVRKDIFCTVYHLKKTPIITRKFDFKLTRKLESLHYIANDFSLIKT